MFLVKHAANIINFHLSKRELCFFSKNAVKNSTDFSQRKNNNLRDRCFGPNWSFFFVHSRHEMSCLHFMVVKNFDYL